MDVIAPHMDNILKTSDHSKRSSTNTLLHMLFQKLKLADNWHSQTVNTDDIQKKLQPVSKDTAHNKASHSFDSYLFSSYVPTEIRNHILKYTKYYFTYTFQVLDRDVTIQFGIPNSEPDVRTLDSYIKAIFMFLYIVIPIASSKCTKNITICIHLTDFKKKKPANSVDIISPSHVNSAVTTSCTGAHNKIFIYRKEEWFKVFIHESFHSFGLDFSSMDVTKLEQDIQSIFHLRAPVRAYEAYSEYWATVLNIAFCSYYMLDHKKDKQNFLMYYDVCLSFERFFSLFQAVKVLDHSQLRYADLCCEHNKDDALRAHFYKERTHAFSYYILKTILLFHSESFLKWCLDHNGKNIMRFTHSQTNQMHFFRFIEQHYAKKHLLKAAHNMVSFYNKMRVKKRTNAENILFHTMRMSLCEIS